MSHLRHSLSQLLTRLVGQTMITRLAIGVPPRAGAPFCSSVHSSATPCSVLPRPISSARMLHSSTLCQTKTQPTPGWPGRKLLQPILTLKGNTHCTAGAREACLSSCSSTFKHTFPNQDPEDRHVACADETQMRGGSLTSRGRRTPSPCGR